MKEFTRTCLAKLVSAVPNGVLLDDRFFELFQKKGLHILPVNFYQPIPDTRELSEELWKRPKELVGVDTRLPQQVALLRSISESYLREYLAISADAPSREGEYTRACGFSGIDGALLYAMIRAHKPRRIVEVGSGASTLLALRALERNLEEDERSGCTLTAIEPYPAPYLHDALRGRGRLIEQKVERVPLDEFTSLEENDILFIDSSHTVRIGGDVVFEILEVLPRLKKGVLVHVHDIFLPEEYPRDWVLDRYVFWNEQYLFHAFMAFNSAFETLWGSGCMHVHQPDELARHFPDYDRTKPSAASYWIRRKSGAS